MIIPPQFLAIGGALALLAGFAGGWTVREWRCEAQVAKIERAADKTRARNQTKVEQGATEYETERHDANEATTTRTREIRTKYVQVPGTCDPGPDVGRVLDDALAAANGGAPREPGAAVPEPSAKADSVR